MVNNLKPTWWTSINEVVKEAKVIFASGLYADLKSEAQAATIIMRGRELGMGPTEACQVIRIVRGKLTFDYAWIGGRIKASGKYNYRTVEHGETSCTLEFYENGESVGLSVFNQSHANKAGLLGNSMYDKYGRNMYFSRALTNGARWYCAEVFGGSVYTADEIQGDEEASETQAPKKKTVTHYDGKLSNGKDPQSYTPEQIKHLLTTASIRVKLTSRDIELLETRLASEGNDERSDGLEVQAGGDVLSSGSELEASEERSSVLRPTDSPDPRASGSDVGAKKVSDHAGVSDSAGDASSSPAVGDSATGPGRSKKRHGEYPSVR